MMIHNNTLEVFTYQTATTLSANDEPFPLINNSAGLEEEDLRLFIKNSIPVTVFLSILCFLGTTGNILALFIFKRYTQSPLRILLLWMVTADLVTCVLCIPLELVQVRYTLTYPSVSLCKITRYLTHYLSLTAGTLLISVALERRQKVCAPLRWQLSLEISKRLTIIIALSCAAISVPAIFVYDVVDKRDLMSEYGKVVGKGCQDIKQEGSIVQVYVALVITACFIGFIVCAVAYTHIVHVIRRQLKTEKHRTMKFSEAISATDDPSSSEITSRKDSIAFDTLEQFSSTLQRRKKRQKRFKESRTTSIMLLVATGVSFTGFLLHVTSVLIYIIVGLENLGDFNFMYSILLRGYFLHSAIHPIVYLSFDKQFRNECRSLYRNVITR